jgi:nitrogen fixation-related uncharacterized protein
MRGTIQLILTAVLLILSAWVWAGQGKQFADEFPSDVASAWFEALYDIVKAEETTPPPAARIYGITAVALYESIVDGTQVNQSLVGQLNDLTSLPRLKKNKKYHWPTVANAALTYSGALQ